MSTVLAFLAALGSAACFTNLRATMTDGEFLSVLLAGIGLAGLTVWLAMLALTPVLWP